MSTKRTKQPTTPTPVVQIRVTVGGKTWETTLDGRLVELRSK